MTADAIYSEEPSPARWLSRFGFGLALAVVIARGMLPVFLRDIGPLMAVEHPAPQPAGATASILFDALALLAALLVALRAAVDRDWPLLRVWSLLPLAALAIWAFTSTLWASDRFMSAVAGSTWLAAAALVFVFAQTVRSWWRLRIVVGVAAGLFLANVAFGVIYRTVELPEFRRNFQENREEQLRLAGYEPGTFAAENFENRLMRGQTGGFARSPNTFGATLVLLGLTTFGIAWQRWREKDRPWALVIAAALVPGAWILWTTGSRTAIGALFLAGLALAVLWPIRSWLAGRRALVMPVLVAGALAGGAAFYWMGSTDRLPHDSLTFRWHYWVGAWGVITERPLLGVGFGNFGEFYLAHRLPVAAEEVDDPHNMLVRFASEAGLIGLLLALAWLLAFAWEQTRPANRPEDDPGNTARPIMLRGMVLIALAGLIIHIFAAIDFTADGGWVFLELMRRGLYGLLIIGGMILAAVRSTDDPAPSTLPAPALAAAILAGLAAALLHSMMDVVVFEPPLLVSFAMLMGAVLGIRAPVPRHRTRIIPAALAAALAAGLGAFVVLLAFPLGMSESYAADGNRLLRAGRPQQAIQAYRQAAEWSPVSNHEHYRRAAIASILAGRPPNEARALLQRALEAHPRNIAPRWALAQVYAEHFSPPRLPEAQQMLQEAVELNPNEMSLRLALATLLERQHDAAGAAEQLRMVLWYNDRLHPREPERLTPEQVEQIQQRIARLEQAPAV